MKKLFWVFLFQVTFLPLTAQDAVLPEDLRQHNLTQFNSSLLNPVFSLNRNNPQAISLWSRWQWQTIDGDPTSIFLSYSGKINPESGFSVGFLQHNTGTFLNTGGVLNYAHTIISEDNLKLLFGVNVLGFQQKLADDNLINDDDLDLPQLQGSSEFLLRVNPGIGLQVNDFNLGLALENGINLISSDNGTVDSGKNFVGMVSNDFPIFLFDGVDNAFLRPSLYVKTVSNSDTQFGLNTLLSTSKFWFQGGYNSFYGPSVGLGGTFAKNISIGGLFEFPTGTDLNDESSTFELLLSYHFGKTDNRRKVVGFELEEPEELIEPEDTEEVVEVEKMPEEVEDIPEEQVIKKKRETRRERLARQQQQRDSLRRIEMERRNAAIRDSINLVKAEAERKRVQDSVNQVKRAQEAALLAEQQRKDSIAELQRQEVEVGANEKYEEVKTAEGLEPGFYLIANVFGTKRYYENFMKALVEKGLEPKSFYRKLNGYNYVYLGRYNTIDEARKARDSKFDGKYPDKTWIFRVRGD